MDLFLANPDYSDTAVTRLQKRMWCIPLFLSYISFFVVRILQKESKWVLESLKQRYVTYGARHCGIGFRHI